MFKINGTEYGDKIIMDTYNVNLMDVYTQWEDANGKYHRSIYKKRISGSFNMKFASLGEYQAFLTNVQNNTQNGGYVPVVLAVNNTNSESSAEMFISFQPVQTRNNNYTKGYMEFGVNVEER